MTFNLPEEHQAKDLDKENLDMQLESSSNQIIIKTLQEELAHAQTTGKLHQELIQKMEGRNKALQGICTMHEKRTGFQKQVQTLEKKKASLERKLAVAEGRVQAKTNQVSKLQATVDALQEKLNKARGEAHSVRVDIELLKMDDGLKVTREALEYRQCLARGQVPSLILQAKLRARRQHELHRHFLHWQGDREDNVPIMNAISSYLQPRRQQQHPNYTNLIQSQLEAYHHSSTQTVRVASAYVIPLMQPTLPSYGSSGLGQHHHFPSTAAFLVSLNTTRLHVLLP